MYSWIDDVVEGLKDTYGSTDIYELFDYLEIKIVKLEPSNILLKGNESLYYRDFLEKEIVFIRNDLHERYKKFILAHELGHALLHTNTYEAAFNKDLLNTGKLEKEANYFAFRMMNVQFDEIELEGMCLEQIASYIEIPYKPFSQIINL